MHIILACLFHLLLLIQLVTPHWEPSPTLIFTKEPCDQFYSQYIASWCRKKYRFCNPSLQTIKDQHVGVILQFESILKQLKYYRSKSVSTGFLSKCMLTHGPLSEHKHFVSIYVPLVTLPFIVQYSLYNRVQSPTAFVVSYDSQSSGESV